MSLMVETAFHASCGVYYGEKAFLPPYGCNDASEIHTNRTFQFEFPRRKFVRLQSALVPSDWRNWLWSISGRTIKLAVIAETPLSKLLIELSRTALMRIIQHNITAFILIIKLVFNYDRRRRKCVARKQVPLFDGIKSVLRNFNKINKRFKWILFALLVQCNSQAYCEIQNQ